jgi:hypothetical protein
VTRLDGSPVVRLLRPVGNVNGMNGTSGRRQPGAGDER